MKSLFEIERIQKEVMEICNKLYKPSSKENYFVSDNDTVENVKSTILKNFSNDEFRKITYLDMAAYILQVKNDVFISIN